jgi:hypothetical protein
MTKIDLEKDLETIHCFRMRILIYYIGFWYEKENRELEKNKLSKIYRYLVDNKLEIQDIFYDENNYNNVLTILDSYKVEYDDFQGDALLYDVKSTLIEKKYNYNQDKLISSI